MLCLSDGLLHGRLLLRTLIQITNFAPRAIHLQVVTTGTCSSDGFLDKLPLLRSLIELKELQNRLLLERTTTRGASSPKEFAYSKHLARVQYVFHLCWQMLCYLGPTLRRAD